MQGTAAWERYLGGGGIPGIGPGLAARLVRRFGETLDAALEAPDRLTEVAGIGPATARAVAAWWRQERGRAGVMLELLRLGLPLWVARRAYAHWREAAPARVRQDPYGLTALAGIGFATADAAARAGGLAEDDPRRWRAALAAALDEAEAEGHCCVSQADWVRRAAALIGAGQRTHEAPLEGPWVRAGGLVYPRGLYRAEREIEACWAALRAARPSPPPPGELDETGVRLTAAQRQAVVLSLAEPISVLTGLPGTGKTTAVRAEVAAARRRGERVRLMAPTAKAARRLAEAAGLDATTIHRALGWRPAPAGPRWTHHPGHPLEADLVVVDEASMLDVRLARDLVRAVRPGTRLWLVGDAAQLPPVGPGRVFADVIAHGGVPVTRLTEVQRQAAGSGIVRLAHAVHAGRWPVPETWGDPAVRWVAADAAGAAAAVARLVREARRAGEDVQVLTALRQGPDGVAALNAAIQAAVNPGPPGWRGLRPGDRVVVTRNQPDLDLVNGEQGVVLEADAAARRLIVEVEGRAVRVPPAAARDVELGYAMTVHRAQGSEWPVVVVVLTRRQYVLLRRELLYTALTRARERLVLVGETWAFRVAATNAREQRRGSTLFRRVAVAGEEEAWNAEASDG